MRIFDLVKKTVPMGLSFILFAITGCSTTSHAQNGGVVTRINFAEECTVTKERVETTGELLALALIPPLVEKGVTALGNALKKAGEAEEFTTSALETMNFYELDKTGTSFATNREYTCVIVYRAEIGQGEASDAMKATESFQESAERLNEEFKIIDTPKFYYEALLQPSNDRSAFKLAPQFIYYGEKLGTKKDPKKLVMNIAFSRPSSGTEVNAFAQFSTSLVRTGAPLIVDSDEFLAGYQSGYLPLPAPSSAASQALTLLATQEKQLSSLKRQLAALDKKDDPSIESLEAQLVAALKELADMDVPEEIKELKDALKAATDSGMDQSELDDLQQKIVAAQAFKAVEDRIKNIEKAIEAKRAALAATEERAKLAKAIPALERSVKRSRALLNDSTPVNATVTLVETTDENKFLIALGEAIAGAAETAKTEVTEALTDKDDETKLQENVEILKANSELRVAAINAVNAWRNARKTYDGANAGAKQGALAALRVAYLQAELSCDLVSLNGLVEPECLALEPPPAS